MVNKALKEIYRNLNNGYSYVQYVKNVKYPYFHYVLSADHYFIRWNNYGSSANKNKITELNWIIKEIFRTTPEQFRKDYLCIFD